MSKYYTGVDFGSASGDFTSYCTVRTLRWYERLLYKVRRKPVPTYIVVSMSTEEHSND